MFDLRYHVASLAAVFVSLALGIVIGVAIASGGEVEKQTADFVKRDRDELRVELERLEEQLEQTRLAAQADAEFVDALYLPVVQGRLAGARIALVQLGGGDSGTAEDVEDVLRTAGASGPSLVVELPLAGDEVDAALLADPVLAAYAGEANREALGEALGEELATVGSGPLWVALQGVIAAEVSGVTPDSLDGAAVVRTWDPTEDGLPDPESPEVKETDAFLTGLLRGLASPGIPVVGAERLSDDPSMIPFFEESDISSVDDVGRSGGNISLALLLGGATPGHYGAKETAVDGVVPPLPDDLVLATDGG
ncbi:MAG: copper transporter [Gaiellales bacterium]